MPAGVAGQEGHRRQLGGRHSRRWNGSRDVEEARTSGLHAYQLKRWFGWCEGHGLDPLLGVQRAHVELYIRGLGESGLLDSSVTTMMHGVRGSSGSHTSTV